MKLAVLTSRFPHPLEKGDKLRIYHQLRMLSSQGFQLHLFSLSDSYPSRDSLAALQAICKGVRVYRVPVWKSWWNAIRGWFGGLPLQVSYFFDRSTHKALAEDLHRLKPDLVYCQLIRMAPYVPHGLCPSVLDYMDAFSFIMAKRASDARGPMHWIYGEEARRLASFEKKQANAFQALTIISKRDRRVLGVESSDQIIVTPNGVDLHYFQPNRAQLQEYHLIFVGNMGYHPNVEAVTWAYNKLLSELWRNWPELRFLVAGARPNRAVRALEGDLVTISGWMEDIRDAYGKGRIFIAPLFHGGGQQNKLLEAMAMGLPCVTTSRVNDSIEARPGKEILIADDESGFLQHIRSLLEDPEMARNIGEHARQFVVEHYSWRKGAEILASLFRNLAPNEEGGRHGKTMVEPKC